MAKQIYKKVNDKMQGARIRAARIEAGYTQVTAADALNANQSEIAIYEAGKRIPKDTTLKKIAKAYGVKEADLRFGDSYSFDFEDSKDESKFVYESSSKKKGKTKQDVVDALDELVKPASFDSLYDIVEAFKIHESDKNFQKWEEEADLENKALILKAKDLLNIKTLYPADYKQYKAGKLTYEELVAIVEEKFAKENNLTEDKK